MQSPLRLLPRVGLIPWIVSMIFGFARNIPKILSSHP